MREENCYRWRTDSKLRLMSIIKKILKGNVENGKEVGTYHRELKESGIEATKVRR